MNLMKKKKGFTLIELMAVIAIIAILAAVLVPTVTGYINRSKKTAIITQCRSVVTAMETSNITTTDGKELVYDETTVEKAISTDGIFEGNDLLTEKNVDRIKAATLAEVKRINDNDDGDILNKIVLDGNNFKSLKE